MTLSRKHFLAHGLAAYGRDLLLGLLAPHAPPAAAPAGEQSGKILVDNRNCLAQRGGCFTCLDRCPREAITIRPGEGIAVDDEKCDGCGICIDCCPVAPGALSCVSTPPSAPGTT